MTCAINIAHRKPSLIEVLLAAVAGHISFNHQLAVVLDRIRFSTKWPCDHRLDDIAGFILFIFIGCMGTEAGNILDKTIFAIVFDFYGIAGLILNVR